MSDLVSGRYPLQEVFWRCMGMPNNAYQSDVPARTNAVLTGLSTLTAKKNSSATKKGYFAAVPV
ncbi:hypothetical protein, partial [Staphylococcus aureus]|uniref:hypothetical protein n=1 Tax=Staphylococcus aureus TaxID=1280 RepID=UPI001E3E083D